MLVISLSLFLSTFKLTMSSYKYTNVLYIIFFFLSVNYCFILARTVWLYQKIFMVYVCMSEGVNNVCSPIYLQGFSGLDLCRPGAFRHCGRKEVLLLPGQAGTHRFAVGEG